MEPATRDVEGHKDHQCVYYTISPKATRLIGFCDASAKAYAAVVYLWMTLSVFLTPRLFYIGSKGSITNGSSLWRIELQPYEGLFHPNTGNIVLEGKIPPIFPQGG